MPEDQSGWDEQTMMSEKAMARREERLRLHAEDEARESACLDCKERDAEIARLRAGYCEAHEPDNPVLESCGACEAVHQADRAESAERDLEGAWNEIARLRVELDLARTREVVLAEALKAGLGLEESRSGGRHYVIEAQMRAALAATAMVPD